MQHKILITESVQYAHEIIINVKDEEEALNKEIQLDSMISRCDSIEDVLQCLKKIGIKQNDICILKDISGEVEMSID